MDVYEKYKNWKEGEGEDQDRHRHLVRWVIRRRIEDRDRAHKWLQEWNEKHSGSILERDVVEQWKKGNRGQQGEWK
jgi:hypothetical protein